MIMFGEKYQVIFEQIGSENKATFVDISMQRTMNQVHLVPIYSILYYIRLNALFMIHLLKLKASHILIYVCIWMHDSYVFINIAHLRKVGNRTSN